MCNFIFTGLHIIRIHIVCVREYVEQPKQRQVKDIHIIHVQEIMTYVYTCTCIGWKEKYTICPVDTHYCMSNVMIESKLQIESKNKCHCITD